MTEHDLQNWKSGPSKPNLPTNSQSRKPRQAKTKPDGAFEFKELPAGKYYVYAQNILTDREVKQAIEVKPGETTTKTLEMLLK